MSILYDFITLIYPKICFSCGRALLKKEDCICTLCLFNLPKTNFYNEKDNPVEKIFWGRIKIESACSCFYFNKGSNVQKLIHRFKYKGNIEIGIFAGKYLGYFLRDSELYQDIDLIIPVPLHPKRKKKRGFNQSEIIGLGLSEAMGVEIDSKSLYRKLESDTQTNKNKQERWDNVKEIFGLKNLEKLENKHMLLVDDVITTGSTIESCTKVLLNAKGAKVSIATIACSLI